MTRLLDLLLTACGLAGRICLIAAAVCLLLALAGV